MAENGRLNVKDAVRVAVEYVKDLLAPDQLSDVRLEEVELSDDGEYWFVTVGFSRPELQRQRETALTGTAILGLLRPQALGREYKVVKIHAGSGDVQSMKIRQP
jgi:hypothetical protein